MLSRRSLLVAAPGLILALRALADVPTTGAGAPVKVAVGGSLLLDSLSATSVIAYSTRKLRAAYAGKALQVIRTSDSATQDIGFSGNDLDTTSLASFIGASSGRINIWYDQSGNATNAAPDRAGKPIIVNSGSLITLNSKASIRYEGSASDEDLLFTVTQAQPTTTAMVAIQTAAVSNAHLTDGYLPGNRQLISENGATYELYAGTAPATGGTVDTSVHGLITVFDGASSVLYVDNSSTISGTNIGTKGLNQGQIIGCGVFTSSSGGLTIAGDIPEYMAFTSSISSGDRGTLTTSWHNYWGTP